DLDLGILCDRPLSALDRWNLQEELAKCLKRDIDLVDLRSASLVMKMQVITNGKRLYCKSVSLCEAFETYVYSAYCRFQEERKGILEDIEKRGSVYAR
ncbi:MAG: nucleotidyltransferase domain-containing protein, partial [Deltaproteobacteria bacterium]|nr:nucleotidyltransferase domain-containing protein [Deltaproteobacteria bacterium]